MKTYIIVLAMLGKLIEGKYSNAESDDSCRGVIPRKDWGARDPIQVEYLIRPVHNVVIAHTVTPQCGNTSICERQMRAIQADHMDNYHLNDIGLSFVIDDEGHIYEGTGWFKVANHNRHYTMKSIIISFFGEFDETIPTKKALDASKTLISCGIRKGLLDEDYSLYGHRQVSSTKSPGQRFYQEIQTWPHWSRKVDL